MIVLDPAQLAALTAGDLDDLAAARQCVVAIGAGRISGAAAAALLLSDYAAAAARATIIIESPAAWAGVVWRRRDHALRLLNEAGERVEISAAQAHVAGLLDELFIGDWQEWLDRWLAHRSAAALDSAALLTARRGGEVLERAEFSRLFATGEPQRGMEAFLGKRKPRFER